MIKFFISLKNNKNDAALPAKRGRLRRTGIRQGFTLIELLVVIAIIGLLSSMAVYVFNVARVKARDAKRLADVTLIQKALDLYYDDYNSWPEENSSNGSWEYSYEDGGDFIDYLKDYGYIGEVPVDPINSGSKSYRYYVYPAGYEGCDFSKGEFYTLGIMDMETSDGSYPTSPGWRCPGRNWQDESDWVIGKFEGS